MRRSPVTPIPAIRWTSTAFLLAAVALVPALLAPPAQAGEYKGVTMDDSATVAGEELQLNGMALRKKFFVKVYVAGLYLPEKATDGAEVLSADTPRRMVMHWLRDVDGDSICGGWMDGLEANTENPSEDLKGQFDTLCEYTDGAEEGQRFVFDYVPGEGTAVQVGDETEGTIEGKAFADALFASWIGPEPGPGEGFKKDLMTGAGL